MAGWLSACAPVACGLTSLFDVSLHFERDAHGRRGQCILDFGLHGLERHDPIGGELTAIHTPIWGRGRSRQTDKRRTSKCKDDQPRERNSTTVTT